MVSRMFASHVGGTYLWSDCVDMFAVEMAILWGVCSGCMGACVHISGGYIDQAVRDQDTCLLSLLSCYLVVFLCAAEAATALIQA